MIHKTVKNNKKITVTIYIVESSGLLSYLTEIYINTLYSRQKSNIFIAYYFITFLLQLFLNKSEKVISCKKILFCSFYLFN